MKSLQCRGDRARLLQRLRTLRPDTPARWGRMTAPEMLRHLTDVFHAALGERAVDAVAAGHWRETPLKWYALYAPVRWPKGVATFPEVDPHRGGTRPGDFASDMAALAHACERLAAHTGPWLSHPLFGAMSDAEWHRWGYRHMDHHLRQFGV